MGYGLCSRMLTLGYGSCIVILTLGSGVCKSILSLGYGLSRAIPLHNSYQKVNCARARSGWPAYNSTSKQRRFHCDTVARFCQSSPPRGYLCDTVVVSVYLVCVDYIMYIQGYRGTPRFTLIKGELTNSPTAFSQASHWQKRCCTKIHPPPESHRRVCADSPLYNC